MTVGNKNAPFWNHNSAFYREIVQAMPRNGARTLDIGCGTGALLGQLQTRSDYLWGIDADPVALASAAEHAITVRGDFLTAELPTFDYIVAIASLHHMDTTTALTKMKGLLNNGGKLYILGLHRIDTPVEWILAGLGWLPETIESVVRQQADPPVAMTNPTETYKEIKLQAEKILPGARIRRRRHYRYSIEWDKL